MDQPDHVANPDRGQLDRENKNLSLSPFAPKNLVSRDSSAVPSRVSPLILLIYAESSIINHQSGAYSRDSSDFRGDIHFFYTAIPAIG